MSEVPPRKPDPRARSSRPAGAPSPHAQNAGRALPAQQQDRASERSFSAASQLAGPQIQLLPVERPPQPADIASGTEPAGEPMTAPIAEPRSAWGNVFGFLLVVAGAVAASLPDAKWAEWLTPAGEPWTTESCRWIVAGILIIAAISFLRAKPFYFLLTSGLVMLTAYCFDIVVGGKLSAFIDATAGSGAAGRVLAVAALAFGYLIHSSPRAATPNATGVFSLVLIGFAGVGVVYGWYDNSLHVMAPRLGEGINRFVQTWSEECTWAIALILVAIGVAASRTKTVHFLGAFLLGALAYHCVQAGCAKTVAFPSTDGIHIPNIETFSLANVVLWRWVAAGELVLLGIILLHLSLGMGALNVAFALVWMLAGIAAYQQIGRLSVVRVFSEGVAQMAAWPGIGKPPGAPLDMWGLPLPNPRTQMLRPGGSAVGQLPPVPPARAASKGAASRPAPRLPTPLEVERARAEALNSVQQNGSTELPRQALVSEVVPLIWMYLTAILAGIIGITGLRMLSGSTAYRICLFLGLWLGFALGCYALTIVWPRNPDLPWSSWAAEFRESRYHVYVIWLAFLGSMAFAGIWALLLSARTSPWIHASIYSIFLGTVLTIVWVAVLIRFGGFPRLPTWTTIAIAAGQSSMAWVLLMHLTLSGRAGRQGQ